MILYNNAFDLYHTIFRLLHLLKKSPPSKRIEVDRLRIWDFYLLFPSQIFSIKPKRHEKEFKELIKELNVKKENPYQKVYDQRKTLEKIRPYQMAALNCLASYKIIDKALLVDGVVSIISEDILKDYVGSIGDLSSREINIISIVTSVFYDISLTGENGLKMRTNLIESKYDAK
ncbi:ABC-three component system middle component 5 [Mucilaginibacter sp.]|uniref:ABC-three component system middle component 5 n=1 Tax=Mucilaginibacter sp. TaxID=1882438 RepID=UPI0025CF724D|nr:ABC-three component system middle component 5 [Mucilaginibacter sp.]